MGATADVAEETPDTAPAEAGEAAERAALIAELDEAEDAERGEESPAGKRGVQKVARPAETDEETAEEEGEEGSEEEVDDPVEVQSFDSADEFREHLKSLADAGDVRKLEEELGLEKGALKVHGGKLRYVREQSQKAATALSAAEAKTREATNLVQQAQETYGPMVRAKHDFASGTPDGVQRAARFVESHFGVPLTQFVDSVLKAGRGQASAPSGPNPEIADLKLQINKLLEAQTRQQADAVQAQAQERHVAAIRGKLAGTPLARLQDGAKVVYDRIVGSYDKTTGGYRLNLQDAIKATLDDPATKWRLHELGQKTRRQPEAEPRKRLPAGSATRGRPAPKLTPAESEAAERQALIAELEADELKRERAERRSTRSNARR